MNDKEKPTVLNLDLRMVFTQDDDCVEGDGGQILEIKTQNGGGGDFYVISTERWAFDNIEDLIEILKQFQEKHNKVRIDKT